MTDTNPLRTNRNNPKPKIYDAAAKRFIDADPLAWVHLAGLPGKHAELESIKGRYSGNNRADASQDYDRGTS